MTRKEYDKLKPLLKKLGFYPSREVIIGYGTRVNPTDIKNLQDFLDKVIKQFIAQGIEIGKKRKIQELKEILDIKEPLPFQHLGFFRQF